MKIANSEDPDQSAPLGAVWSGSALFAQTYLSENLGSLRYAESRFSHNADHLQPFNMFQGTVIFPYHSIAVWCPLWQQFTSIKDTSFHQYLNLFPEKVEEEEIWQEIFKYQIQTNQWLCHGSLVHDICMSKNTQISDTMANQTLQHIPKCILRIELNHILSA